MIDGYYAIDYQVHSFRSHDGLASIEAQCRRAVEIGLDEIGFSEHKDFDPADPVVEHFDYAAYMAEIDAARRQFGETLTIRAGVEIDYQDWFENRIADYLNANPFDFVIGSVHYVGRHTVMSPDYNRTRDPYRAYDDYFQAVRRSVASGLFDILGHLEYANRRGVAAWGPYDHTAHRATLSKLFDDMIARGVALEINTAGLHQGIGLTYPYAATVALYAERGGRKLSIGSDAHQPAQLGHAYAVAARMALAVGIESVCTWDRRAARSVPLRRKTAG